MQVWLYDNQLQRAVEAELQVLTHEHVDRANATWVPEFRSRRQMRATDQDFLVWDWPSKEKYLLEKNTVRDYAVARGDSVEGILILQEPEPSRLESPNRVLYVRYLATAPWNRLRGDRPGQYSRVGTILLGQAVRESLALGCQGRLGLHSLSNSDAFYRKLQFHDLGPDPANRGLTYFELATTQATPLLDAQAARPKEVPTAARRLG
jgi:hypothetical protein